MTQKLHTSFLLTGKDVKKSLGGFYKEARGVYKPTVEMPDLTNEQKFHPLAASPIEYWKLACCCFQKPSARRFTFPFLTIPQRVFFLYRYCMNKVATNLSLPNVTRINGRIWKQKSHILDHERLSWESVVVQDVRLLHSDTPTIVVVYVSVSSLFLHLDEEFQT